MNQLAATFSQKATETSAGDQRFFFFYVGFEEKRTAIQRNVIKLRQRNGCRNLKISINRKKLLHSVAVAVDSEGILGNNLVAPLFEVCSSKFFISRTK